MVALVTFLMLGSVTLQSCLQDHMPPADNQARLQQLTDSLYQRFNQKWGVEKNKGGVFLQVNTPTGSNLVSSNIEPGVQAKSHFRIASITKTFTAAAIMLLQQEGKLLITDFIPAYLPATPAYAIPNKDQITIKQLLQHRAGVFDVTNQDIPIRSINPTPANDTVITFGKTSSRIRIPSRLMNWSGLSRRTTCPASLRARPSAIPTRVIICWAKLLKRPQACRTVTSLEPGFWSLYN
jgi:CubicO group peptidase (beta-lactamase class C family)